MFKPSTKPRVFGMPLGADFAQNFASGLVKLAADQPPEAFARVEVYVNTSRMKRHLIEKLGEGRHLLLPRIKLVTELSNEYPDDAPPISALREKLEISRLIRGLLEANDARAPKSALFDLSDSLYQLMDEMHGEGVNPGDIEKLDVTDQSGYWQDSLDFIRIVTPMFETGNGNAARQRRAALRKIEEWEAKPPEHPIIIAGSTGSRGATKLLMEAVARLPQGALVLPGFDYDLPEDVWDRLYRKEEKLEDHPQYRFKALMQSLNLAKDDIQNWPDAAPIDPARNKLISLALRPAPVTNAWINEGSQLGHLPEATQHLTVLEADSPRQEAETIAVRMRKALDEGKRIALISPDRMLTRQVSSALTRWDLVADDSAGVPLLLSAPGRLLAQLANLVGNPIASHELLALLKHPLCNSNEEDRGNHLLLTRELELYLRRYGPPIPDRSAITVFAEKQKQSNSAEWGAWVADIIERLSAITSGPLSDTFDNFLQIAERVCAGPSVEGNGRLWAKADGREALLRCQILAKDADAAGEVTATEFSTIFRGVLADGVVRESDIGHPDLQILGTLEARVQSADLVILGGLNEGVWPEAPSPDPWLNRTMRKDLGLLVPERQIGLSSHDFQQAVGAKEVWLTRSTRTAEAETVPSRWLNRLTNLMNGLPDQNGPEAMKAMVDRGDQWKQQANLLSIPPSDVEPEKRPSPCPPVTARPKQLSVTRIQTLIRDPYAIYAESVLKLRELNPLLIDAEAPLRGEIFHAILHEFVRDCPKGNLPDALPTLIDIARRELTEKCPWPAIRLRWLTQFEALAPQFIADEMGRQSDGEVRILEKKGKITLPGRDFTLTGVADRIDIAPDGRARIYDYKTGVVPSIKQQKSFDKQLLLEAAMVVNGAFPGLDPTDVERAEFVSIKPDMKVTKAPLDEQPPDKVWADFNALIAQWSDESLGYTARMAMVKKDDNGRYDHLSRIGEWTVSDAPKKVYLK